MIGLLQRVLEADVSIAGETVGRIERGLLVFAAVHRDDTPRDTRRLAERIAGYRVFADDTGRMNLSLRDTGFGLLLVPQFTLAADTRKGMRASFTHGAPPDKAEEYFLQLVAECRGLIGAAECGRFGADMQVSLTNDGPVTFWLES
ncbi:MAG: D-tyrosyl-tRNA(Tyr) deacylase [Woeseia sp.]|nr:D-tyrosyl-tRNA(Tyr) deacylase [Woeseia sp.]MBT8097522.1 D-tyrosyl-tRNA(Tyr) deacylase [Woeseia sp.]NNE59606.1 D-tyrosyl-tRNA(Tyr) deacylase [Woeseia sp.]NNL55219.1 D-tyrosyl-tRNA(Tyr) deacylase [Woeseia sp.]